MAPAELEAVLLSHDKIADAAVIGLPDEMAGELPLAWVVLKQAGSMTTAEIAKFVEGSVAQHKRLRGGVRVSGFCRQLFNCRRNLIVGFQIVPEIPKSPSGKILRRVIRDTEKAQQAPQAKL